MAPWLPETPAIEPFSMAQIWLLFSFRRKNTIKKFFMEDI